VASALTFFCEMNIRIHVL